MEEYYIPNPQHLKMVEDDVEGDYMDVDYDYLVERRIEINAVIKKIGRERFWEWIVNKLEAEFGEDLNYYPRAIEIPEADEFVPHELRQLNTLVINKIRDVLNPEQEEKKKELSHYDASIEGMIEDVSDYEQEIRDEFQDIVDESADTGPIVKDIKKILKLEVCQFSRIYFLLRYVFLSWLFDVLQRIPVCLMYLKSPSYLTQSLTDFLCPSGNVLRLCMV